VEHLQLTRIQELLGQLQCAVPYTTLYRYALRQGWLSSHRGTVRMADTQPGEVAEMDFGRLGLLPDPESGKRRVVWALVVVLNYSLHSFVWPLFRQSLGEIIEGLESAWAFFKGIPRLLVLDNFPSAIAGPDALDQHLTRGFLEYGQQRGFLTDPARLHHPRDKPKVERQVPCVRERFFKSGQFHGLADLRLQARKWCLEVAGPRLHGTTRRLPLVVFQEEEQSTLLPWDGQPYDLPDWHQAIVHPDHHIAYRYALYSAPHQPCPPGTKLEMRGDSKLMQFYHRGICVKVHPRQPRGGCSTDPQDYPPELTPYTTRVPDRLCRQAAELGASIVAFAEKLLGGPLPWAKVRQVHKLLRLAERYTPARLEAACGKALAVDLIDVRRLEPILTEALESESQPTENRLPALSGTLRPPEQYLRLPSAFLGASKDRFSGASKGRFLGEGRGGLRLHNSGRSADRRGKDDQEMSTTNELRPLLKRLKLGQMLNTLPERLALARHDQLDHAAFLQILLADEVSRRDQRHFEVQLQKAGFEEICRLENFDWTTGIKLERKLLNAVFSLDFLSRWEHVLFVGPVGVGKSFLAQALGFAAVWAGHTARFLRADDFHRTLAQARVDHTLEKAFRSFLAPDLLILDGITLPRAIWLQRLTAQQSSGFYELLITRHRCSSFLITSNRAVDEWLGLFDDSILCNSALDRLANAS